MLAGRMNASVQRLVGRTLGQRYRLERILGMGGMGAVFEALQRGRAQARTGLHGVPAERR
jgi:hypothetical protein